MNIDKESLMKLRCSECRLPLSVGPVTCSSDKFLCGRCSGEGTRTEIYEVLAKSFAFPCRYREFGCEEFVQWGSVLSHEQSCPKKPQLCPTDYCTWFDAMENIPAHFEESHVEDYIKVNLIELGLCEDKMWCKLLKIDAGCFVFDAHFSMEKELLEMNVLALADLKEANRNKYQITLHSHNFSKRIILTSAVVKPLAMLNENEESDNMVKNDVLKFLTNDTNVVFCEITLNVQECQEEINQKIMKLLKCPGCDKYFNCPIFKCRNGNSFCELCTSKTSDCPLCHDGLTKIRNCVLEDLANQILHFCMNKDLGCNFAGLLKDVELHQQACDLYRCPLQNFQKCSWNGNFKELVAHSTNKHNYKQTPFTFRIDMTAKKRLSSDLIYFDSRFFRICWMHDNKEFCISIQFVGPHTRASRYFFRWTAETNQHSKLIMKSSCYSLTNEETVFDNSIKVPDSILTHLMGYNIVCRVDIDKKP